MPDNNAAEPQEGTDQQPQEGSADSQAESRQTDPTVLQRELQEARREAAKYRTERQQAQERLQKLEEANLTESERLQRRVADFERQQGEWNEERQALRVGQNVTAEAARMGFANPAIVQRLIDQSRFNFADDGTPTNVTMVLRDLAEAEPYLLIRGGGSFDGGVRPGPVSRDPNAVMNDLLINGRR